MLHGIGSIRMKDTDGEPQCSRRRDGPSGTVWISRCTWTASTERRTAAWAISVWSEQSWV